MESIPFLGVVFVFAGADVRCFVSSGGFTGLSSIVITAGDSSFTFSFAGALGLDWVVSGFSLLVLVLYISPIPLASQSRFMSGNVSTTLIMKSRLGLFRPDNMCDNVERCMFMAAAN